MRSLDPTVGTVVIGVTSSSRWSALLSEAYGSADQTKSATMRLRHRSGLDGCIIGRTVQPRASVGVLEDQGSSSNRRVIKHGAEQATTMPALSHNTSDFPIHYVGALGVVASSDLRVC